jgi:hypothetical protein
MTDPRYVLEAINPELTPKQVVCLVKVMEEASEVIKAAGKLLRFGVKATDLVHRDTTYDNSQLLYDEMRDLQQAYCAWGTACFDAAKPALREERATYKFRPGPFEPEQ